LNSFNETFLHLRKKIRLIHGEGTSDLALLRSAFPDLRFVFLTRRDKVHQAVSYYKALQTDFWHSLRPDATAARAMPVPAPAEAPAPSFDFEQIDRWFTRFTEDEANWCRYFATVGLEPFEVVYEDLVESYESTVLTVLRYLDLSVAAGLQVAPPRLQKQADLVTDEWVRRYQELKC
jgi:LPS sulfotransferase NodH